jgi:hypothetical protein
MNSMHLAHILRPYDVKPGLYKTGPEKGIRGYSASEFTPLWDHYLNQQNAAATRYP